MNIAFCVYGQPRTWKVCLPRTLYQLSQIRELGHTVDLFFHLKNYNSYTNVRGSEHASVSVEEIHSLQSLCTKKGFETSISFTTFGEDQKFAEKSWHYSPMFRSMQNVWAKVGFRETDLGIHYDIVFMGRADLMYRDLNVFIKHEIKPMSVYSKAPVLRMEGEAYQLGFQDYYFYGSAMSMDLLISGTLNLTVGLKHERSYSKLFPMGPNVVLNKVANRSSLMVNHSQLDAALVRPDADSHGDYDYHSKFWTENHSSMTKP